MRWTPRRRCLRKHGCAAALHVLSHFLRRVDAARDHCSAPRAEWSTVRTFRKSSAIARYCFSQHRVEFEGKKPLGVITNIETTGRFSAQLFDVGYVRELMPALRAGTSGMSYKPLGVTRGELNRRPTKSDRNPRGLPEWTFRSVDEVAELSVVTWPADQNACKARTSHRRRAWAQRG